MKKSSSLAVGVIFTIAGTLTFIFMPEKASLSCDRNLQTCQLQNGRWSQPSKQTFPISDLQGATVERNRGRRSSTYRVRLKTPVESIKFMHLASSGQQEKQQIADRINAFVQNPQQRSLQVQQDDRAFPALLSGAFAAIGIYLLLNQLIWKKE